MDIVVVQFLTGLASASSLFLVASGLSIIFGVSRIVNFAHGSFYMLGAYLAWTLVERLPYGPLGFWGGIIGAAAVVALLGLVMETVLLRRIYRAPELFQLLATFGVVLIVQDATLWLWGPQDLLGPRAPGLRGAVTILGQRFPQYDLLLIVIGPVVLLLLWLLFTRTRWGTLVRAATQDREMVGALGVDQKLLFTTVFMLGSFLAGLGGALQLPRESVNLQMDISIITDAFVVVVVGGMGSLGGAFLAALLIGVLHAFGIVILPKITLVLIFLVMAVVLVLRPYGLMGRKPGPVAATVGIVTPLIGPTPRALVWLGGALGVLLLAAPLVVGDYGLSILTEMAILALFAASLHFMMGPGGMASFGHAAYFGLGAYAAALVMRQLGLGMPVGLLAAPLAGAAFGLIFGWFCVRLSGVYLAMLTLAFAQICWSVAFQWVELTGGDNGLLNILPSGWAQTRQGFYWLALVLSVGGILALRWLIRTPFGHGLRAARDNPLRAEAVGMAVGRLQWAGFAVAAAFAGFAGGLFAYFKGSVFPTFISIPRSVDALLMVLLGGVDTLAGPIIGAVVYTGLHEQLMSMTDYWRAILGLIIVLLVVAFPQGLAGQARDWWLARQQGGRA